jgi:Zn-dependent protease with chaperone function
VVFGLVVAVGLVADILLRMAFFGGGRRGGNSQSQLFFLIFGLVAAIVAPLLAAVVQAAISRQREYLADATSALTTRDPDGLASALAKLGSTADRSPRRTRRWLTSGSATRFDPVRWSACSPRIHRSRIASPACRKWADGSEF